MKKIIAISVMLVLIAGAVFADTSVGGNLKISASLAAGKTDDDDAVAGGATVWDAYTNVSWSGDNAGGMMRLWTKNNDWQPDLFTFWWWKPIEQLRLQLGKNADGDWGHAQITGWGYNAEAQGGIVIDQHRGIKSLSTETGFNSTSSCLARTSDAFWGGFGALGLAVSIFPAQGFEINIGLPFQGKTDKNKEAIAAAVYSNTKINFKVDIPDIGTVRLAADLKKGTTDAKGNFHFDQDADLQTDIYFAFYLSAIENMGLELGASFTNEFEKINIGLGVRYSADDLTIKSRIGFVSKENNTAFGIGILPSYNLGNMVFYFNAGFGMNLDKETKDWFVNPYIRVPANAGNFYAGIKILDNGDEKMAWEIPIGWNVYF
jgi:hypothetical protein